MPVFVGLCRRSRLRFAPDGGAAKWLVWRRYGSLPEVTLLSRRPTLAVVTAVAAASLALAGCASSKSGGGGSAGAGGGGSSSGSGSSSAPASGGGSGSSSPAALVPAAIKSKGSITVALDATYPPDESVGTGGHTVVGMDADLAKAIAQELGLKASLVNATFDTIIPGLQGGKFDVGMSSFTDTKKREQIVTS